MASCDIKGRKKLYGIELMIVIIGTIGLVQSSKGYNSMNVYAWIGVWRFIQGVGLGAEVRQYITLLVITLAIVRLT